MTFPDLAPYIWVAWDLLAVFIIFRRAQVCARKGFIATLMSFLVYIAAVTAAGYANKYMAAYLYDNVVREMVLHTLTRNFNIAASGVGGANADLLAAIPLLLRLLMRDEGPDAVDLSVVNGAAATDMAIEGFATQIVDAALKEPLMAVLTTVSFLLVFSVVAFFMRTLTRMFTGVNSIPVIGGANAVLGCIFGLLEAALILYVGAFGLRLLTVFTGASLWWLNDGVINATYIWSILY